MTHGPTESMAQATDEQTALLLTVTQAAQALAIGRTKLYELVNDGSLHAVHVGRSVRIARQELVLFVERLRAQPGVRPRQSMSL
jgi:excisionase family DNA binding protein